MSDPVSKVLSYIETHQYELYVTSCESTYYAKSGEAFGSKATLQDLIACFVLPTFTVSIQQNEWRRHSQPLDGQIEFRSLGRTIVLHAYDTSHELVVASPVVKAVAYVIRKKLEHPGVTLAHLVQKPEAFAQTFANRVSHY